MTRALCALALACTVPAQALKQGPIEGGYIGTMGSTDIHITSKESGARFGGRFEVGILDGNIGLDIRAGTGQGYYDFGGALRFFEHWRLSNAYGLSLGLGLGLLYSPGVDDGNAFTSDAFLDPFLGPFARFIYDTRRGWAFVLEGSVDAIPNRIKSLGDAQAQRDPTFRTRLLFGLGVIFDYKTGVQID